MSKFCVLYDLPPAVGCSVGDGRGVDGAAGDDSCGGGGDDVNDVHRPRYQPEKRFHCHGCCVAHRTNV